MMLLPILAEADGDLNKWYLVSQVVLAVLVIVGFFKPQPALHKQFADKEETGELIAKLFELVEKLDDKIDREIKDASRDGNQSRRALHNKVNGISCALWELSGRFPEMKKHLHKDTDNSEE